MANKEKKDPEVIVDLGLEKIEDDSVDENSENYLDLLKEAGKELGEKDK